MAPEGSADQSDDDAQWSNLHGGVQPSPVVRGWLRLIRKLAAGPVSHIPPDALSVAGVLALAAAWGVVAGPGWPALVVPLVLAAGVLDGLDGAVALRTGRARPLGAVIDSVADRVGDVLLGAVLLAIGAPLGWVLAALALVLSTASTCGSRPVGGHAGGRCGDRRGTADASHRGRDGGRRRRGFARRTPASGLGLGRHVRGDLDCDRRRRNGAAAARRVARRCQRTFRANVLQRQRDWRRSPPTSAPAGCRRRDAPTRPPGRDPAPGLRFAGRRSAARGPCEAEP